MITINMDFLKLAITSILLTYAAADETRNCTYTPCKLETCGIMNNTQFCNQLCNKTPCEANCYEPSASCRQDCPVGNCGELHCKGKACLQMCKGTGSCPIKCESENCRLQCSQNCSITCNGKECRSACQSGCDVNCDSEACFLDCPQGSCTLKSGKQTQVTELYCPTGDCKLMCHENTPTNKCQCLNCTSITYYSGAAHLHTGNIGLGIIFILPFLHAWI